MCNVTELPKSVLKVIEGKEFIYHQRKLLPTSAKVINGETLYHLAFRDFNLYVRLV